MSIHPATSVGALSSTTPKRSVARLVGAVTAGGCAVSFGVGAIGIVLLGPTSGVVMWLAQIGVCVCLGACFAALSARYARGPTAAALDAAPPAGGD